MNPAPLMLVLHAAVCGCVQNAVAPPAPQEHQHGVRPHAAGVDSRGAHAMGFSQETTTHHFTLLMDGGIISVETKADSDDATREQIRMHLSHIASMFSANNFDIPMFIHGKIPPGVPTMKAKHARISYTFEPTERGARVRIQTHDADATRAVHRFLRFQIEDHRTGDPTQIAAHS
jgi:hypothetical protein